MMMTKTRHENGARRRTQRSRRRTFKQLYKQHTINDLITHTLLVLLAITCTFKLICSAAAETTHRRRSQPLEDEHYLELRRLPPAAQRRHKPNAEDMAAADQLDEPVTSMLEPAGSYALDNSGQGEQQDAEAADSPFTTLTANNAHHHNSQLRAMRDLFERRQLVGPATGARMGQSSQELSPISIGLDPNSPFGMPPFGGPVGGGGGNDGASPPPPRGLANADEGGAGGLPFGLNPLPHLLGFQGPPGVPFDGPQRGDQSAHSNHHTAAAAASQATSTGGPADPELGPSQKVWPKIFRFTDGRINLSDFEKQKKIRLSSKNQHGENHIESAPIMFDGRQLKRKSFLILHGGIFQGNL